MNASAGTLTRPLLRVLSVVAIVVVAAGCGDDSGDTADAPATVATTPAGETSAATEPAGTAAADTTPATTAPPPSEPATTTPSTTTVVESTLPPTTLPTPTTTASATTEPAATAPPTTEPVVSATTSPPAPSTTAAPIVIGGLTLATCIASEYFGFDAVEPRAEVALYQYTLRNLGYDPGAIDGYFGPMTIEAGANEIMDHTTDNAGLFIDEGVIARDAFVRLGIAC